RPTTERNAVTPARAPAPIRPAPWHRSGTRPEPRLRCSIAMTTAAESARTYDIRTYGCQMNVHDSERIAGLLEDAGYVRAADAGAADVVVFNTCAVRENADNRLYGNLGHLRPAKLANPH